jgi:hypothetical protein
MEKMWLILTEIIGDSKGSSSDSEIGFMNITTWAESQEIAGEKIRRYLASCGWHLVSVEKADVIDEELQYGEDVSEMIERTRPNPNAIILGSFHTYKTN